MDDVGHLVLGWDAEEQRPFIWGTGRTVEDAIADAVENTPYDPSLPGHDEIPWRTWRDYEPGTEDEPDAPFDEYHEVDLSRPIPWQVVRCAGWLVGERLAHDEFHVLVWDWDLRGYDYPEERPAAQSDPGLLGRWLIRHIASLAGAEPLI